MAEKVCYKGRHIGTIEKASENHRVYRKETKPKHYVRKYDGIGITAKVFKDEGRTPDIRKMCDTIAVKHLDRHGDKTLYLSSVEHYHENSTENQLGNFEPQLFLSFPDFQHRTKKPPKKAAREFKEKISLGV
jgi:hypothetical protein